jgi:murein L,D-transpeptidase YafK
VSLPAKRTLSLALLLSIAGAAAWAHWPQSPLPNGTQADRVVVRKSARTLQLYRGKELLRTYPVALGCDPLRNKNQQGDGWTPEGLYVLDYRNASSGF